MVKQLKKKFNLTLFCFVDLLNTHYFDHEVKIFLYFFYFIDQYI